MIIDFEKTKNKLLKEIYYDLNYQISAGFVVEILDQAITAEKAFELMADVFKRIPCIHCPINRERTGQYCGNRGNEECKIGVVNYFIEKAREQDGN